MWFLGEWWNDASSDNFAYIFGFISDWKLFNFNQILSLFLMAWGAWRVAHIVPSPLSEWVLEAGDVVMERSKKISKYISALTKKVRKSWKSR